ncbi:MAG: hypothetical protein AAFX76_05375 [Planctomycetota bacterium]
MSLRTRPSGFSALELLVVIVSVVVLIALLLPMLGGSRRGGHRPMANNTQLRGIHQGFVTFAQSNKIGGNDGFFPGLDGSGNVVSDGEATGHSGDGTHPGARLWVLLEGNFFTPDYMINPADFRAVEAETPPGSDDYEPITADHYSYALLGILAEAERSEWKETLNTSAIVMGDRAVGTGPADLSSVWTEAGSGDWRGGVVRNDNSASFETTHRLEQTKYGGGVYNDWDDFFEDDPDTGDAYLVFRDAATAYSPD